LIYYTIIFKTWRSLRITETMSLPMPTPLSTEATFLIPGPGDTPASVLDRWSNTHMSLPAAVAVPQTEADVVTLVHYAREHRLNFFVGAGKHGSYLPVTP
jgi:hypothetical protein